MTVKCTSKSSADPADGPGEDEKEDFSLLPYTVLDKVFEMHLEKDLDNKCERDLDTLIDFVDSLVFIFEVFLLSELGVTERTDEVLQTSDSSSTTSSGVD